MSIFSEEKIGEHFLVIHIGSASVCAAVVTQSGSQSTIVASTASDIAILSDLSFERFEVEMQNALNRALIFLSRHRYPMPTRARVYFASPWYASQVRTAKMSRPAPFVVSKTLLNDMISRELKAFEDEVLSAKQGTALALRAIESMTVQVKLNGYPQHDPVSLSARELEISLFLSVAPEALLKKIEDLVARHFHMPISFGSFVAASYLVARDFFPHQEDYIILDIGGEVTDVSLVRSDALMQSVSFPRGQNFILRKLSAGLKRSIHESATLLTLLGEGKLEDSMKASVDAILQSAKTEWLESFQKSLFAVSNELSIPDVILLSVGGDTAPWFVGMIQHEEFHQYAHTEKDFKVVVLGASLFHESLTFGSGALRDPFIMIDALADARL